MSDHILTQLLAELPACPEGCQHPVFLLDGSSLELAHTKELASAYPPAENQYGSAHWPMLRIAVMHNLANGLALRPSWGPMSGPDAVSEQALAEELMDRLPPGAVLVGDRNFGVFSIAHASSVKTLFLCSGCCAGRLAGSRRRRFPRPIHLPLSGYAPPRRSL